MDNGLAPAVTFSAAWQAALVDVPPLPDGVLRVVPLGGLGQIGKNMLVLHYGDDLVIIDCGVMFPRAWMLGVDLVLPNFSYVVKHRAQVRALLLTHGHEDHIGAIPYLWPHLPEVPIFGTKLTLGMVRNRCLEYGLADRLVTREVQAGDRVAVGRLQAEFFHVVHSISDAVGVALRTPLGIVVHTGDFKFDATSQGGRDTDSAHLSRLGDEGVALLLSDSTYAERSGVSTSDAVVGQTLRRVFARCQGRIVLTAFSSSTPRLQQVVDAAVACGRRLCFHGRSLEACVGVATEVGHLVVPSEARVAIEDIEQVPDDRLVLLVTGSQGEPMSALALMATGRHRHLTLKSTDTVVLSATPVPGNEVAVGQMIDHLCRRGVEVVYDVRAKSEAAGAAEQRVHASGHASRGELARMMALTRPALLMPVHGEYRMLVQHARLGAEQGLRTLVVEDGQVVDLCRTEAGVTGSVVGEVPSDPIMVDGASVGEVVPPLLRDRTSLGECGVCVVAVALQRQSGAVVSGPQCLTRGFLRHPAPDVLEGAQGVAKSIIDGLAGRPLDDASLEGARGMLKGHLGKFFLERVGRRPVVVPLILEV